MISFTLDSIISLIRTYGYEIIFPLSIVEGPIVAVLSGFIASLGRLNIFFVFLVLLAGDIVGDTIHYVIGRWGRHNFIKKWGKYIGVTEEKIQALEKYFEKHNWKILAFGKTQPIGSAILISAGLAGMPYWSYIWYNILSTIPKIFILEMIGYYFGDAYYKISSLLSYAGIASLIIAILFIGLYIWLQSYLKKRGPNIDKV